MNPQFLTPDQAFSHNFNPKKKGGETRNMLKITSMLAIVGALGALLVTDSANAEEIAKQKKEIGDALADLKKEGNTEVESLVEKLNHFASKVAAATAPSEADVRNAAVIGEVKIPDAAPEAPPAPPPDGNSENK